MSLPTLLPYTPASRKPLGPLFLAYRSAPFSPTFPTFPAASCGSDFTTRFPALPLLSGETLQCFFLPRRTGKHRATGQAPCNRAAPGEKQETPRRGSAHAGSAHPTRPAHLARPAHHMLRPTARPAPGLAAAAGGRRRQSERPPPCRARGSPCKPGAGGSARGTAGWRSATSALPSATA